MRARHVLAALLAAAPLATTAVSGAPSASRTPEVPAPCPPGYVETPSSGFDGGPGCRLVHEPERPAELMAAQAAYAGPRTTGSGERRLAAFQQAQRMRADAEARRARLGLTAVPDGAGALVPDSANRWRDLGPKPIHADDPQFGPSILGWTEVTGRVSVLTVDPRDETGGTVYLGAAAGGVWKTTDAGTSWRAIGDDLPSLAIGSIALDPVDGDLFVGTGEANTAADNYAGSGAFRSTDDGATWTPIAGVPSDTVIGRVAVADDVVLVATSRGLYRSTDGGLTATRVDLPTGSDADLGSYVSDVAIQPGSPDVVTAAVGWRSGGVEGAGLYRSNDGGASFEKLTAIGFGSASTSSDPIGRTSLAYPTNPEQDTDILWAVVQDPGKLRNDNNPLGITQPGQTVSTTLNGVYMSRDNGATWEVKATAENLIASPGTALAAFAALDYQPGLQSWYNQYIQIDPTDQNRVLLGLEEIYTNTTPAITPGLLQWRTVGRFWNACLAISLSCDPIPTYNGKTTHADQHAAAFAVTPDGVRAYVAGDGGAYYQDPEPGQLGFENNDAWTSLNSALPITQPYAATMGRDGTVYLGLQDNGTVRITPDGRADMVFGGDGFDVAVDPDDSNVAFSEVQFGAIRRTNDGGVSWTTITPGTGNSRARFHTPFELDPTDPEHLVYASGQVWATAEAGSVSSSSWTQVFDLATDAVPNGAGTALDVQGDAVYVAFCGTAGATAAASTDCNALSPDGNVDPALFAGGIATNVKPGCAREKGADPNACWHVVGGAGLPKRQVLGIEIDPTDPSTVYAAVTSYSRRFVYDAEQRLEGHVYKSTDAGETWTDISGDLPDAFASDLLVQGGRLIVATDVGVFATASTTSTDWEPLGTGLPAAVPAYELNTNPQGDTLVLATHGRGVWALPLTGRAPTPVDPGPSRPPRPAPRPGVPLPSTGAPAWLVLAPALAGVALVLLRRRRASTAP
jgi:hypothetical protein